MALRFCDGFDWCTTKASLTKKYATIGSTAMIPHTDYGRNGGRGVDLEGTDAGMSVTFDSQQIWIVGHAMYVTTYFPSTDWDYLFSLYDGATLQMRMRINYDGTITAFLGASTVLGTSVATVPFQTWIYLEAKIKIADSPNGYVIVCVNGATIWSLTGVDTKSSANASANGIVFGRTSNDQFHYVDDLYVCDVTGGVNDDFLGDVRVETILPTADSAVQWTPSAGSNWQNVDDADPSAADYNEDDVAGHKDKFVLANPATTAYSVKGVQSMLYAEDDAALHTVRSLLNINASDYVGTTKNPGSDPLLFLDVWNVNPDDSAAFEQADIEALIAGYELVA